MIDWITDREPFSTYAAQIIELTEKELIKSYISPLTIANSYYIISRQINKNIAYEFVKDCIRLFEIAEITAETINFAYENRFKDFEDDVHTAIAEKQSVEYIITRNKKDFRSEKISIVDAEELVHIIHTR
ncbi:type II toxin-antitoxin system VapC family toxin [Spirochaeta africana]|uniref:type II toxin-antitoxin system VapC family toxin n=1 Tax=Spirochaeta africana TaxID=46355 RepID=UPI00145CA57E|nr:PIN domain-containing protein [Spirochaeta africana]